MPILKPDQIDRDHLTKPPKRIAKAGLERIQIGLIMLFQHCHGVTTGRTVRIFKTYANLAVRADQRISGPH